MARCLPLILMICLVLFLDAAHPMEPEATNNGEELLALRRENAALRALVVYPDGLPARRRHMLTDYDGVETTLGNERVAVRKSRVPGSFSSARLCVLLDVLVCMYVLVCVIVSVC